MHCVPMGPYMSRRTNVRMTNVSKDKCQEDKCLDGQMPGRTNASKDKSLEGQMPRRTNASTDKCQEGQMPRRTNVSKDKCLKGQMPQRTNASTGICLPRHCLSSEAFVLRGIFLLTPPKKELFRAQSNMKLDKSALCHKIHCFALFSMA